MRAGRVCAAVAAAAVLAVTGVVTAAVATDEPAPAATPAVDSADAGFARDMSVHHQQAVEMSFIVRDRTDDEEIRTLAYDIANTQANQRGMMLGWLDLWELPKSTADGPMAWMGMRDTAGDDGALMPGMATRAELEKLRTASGKKAEILYLRLMTAHHNGGIHMAQGCADRCTVGAELRLARGMVASQQSEVDLMADLLKERGARAEPSKGGG